MHNVLVQQEIIDFRRVQMWWHMYATTQIRLVCVCQSDICVTFHNFCVQQCYLRMLYQYIVCLYILHIIFRNFCVACKCGPSSRANGPNPYLLHADIKMNTSVHTDESSVTVTEEHLPDRTLTTRTTPVDQSDESSVTVTKDHLPDRTPTTLTTPVASAIPVWKLTTNFGGNQKHNQVTSLEFRDKFVPHSSNIH